MNKYDKNKFTYVPLARGGFYREKQLTVEEENKRRNIMGKGSALQKEMRCSDELRELVKEKKISRGQMMKAVWRYIKKHKLQGAKNEKGKKDNRWIQPDDKLGAVIGTKPISMFKMTAKLSKHLS